VRIKRNYGHCAKVAGSLALPQTSIVVNRGEFGRRLISPVATPMAVKRISLGPRCWKFGLTRLPECNAHPSSSGVPCSTQVWQRPPYRPNPVEDSCDHATRRSVTRGKSSAGLSANDRSQSPSAASRDHRGVRIYDLGCIASTEFLLHILRVAHRCVHIGRRARNPHDPRSKLRASTFASVHLAGELRPANYSPISGSVGHFDAEVRRPSDLPDWLRKRVNH